MDRQQKEKELYSSAEAGIAVHLAKKVLATAEPGKMERAEQEEFERIEKMVEAADFIEHPPRPESGSAASVWVIFLEAYLKTALYYRDDIASEIKSTFERARRNLDEHRDG